MQVILTIDVSFECEINVASNQHAYLHPIPGVKVEENLDLKLYNVDG